MPTRLPYLKGTSQFLTTGGDEEEEGGREEREGVNFSCRKLKATRGCITAEKFQQQQTNKAYINVCDLCFYVDKTGRFVVVFFVVGGGGEVVVGGVFTTVHIHHALSGNFLTMIEVPCRL